MQESARVSRTTQVTRPVPSLPRPRPDEDQPSRGLLHAPPHYSPREVGDLGWHRLLFPTLVLYVIKTHRPVPHVCCCIANHQETSQPKIAFKSHLGPHGSLQPPSFLCFVTKLLEHRPRSGTLAASLCPGVPLAPRPPAPSCGSSGAALIRGTRDLFTVGPSQHSPVFSSSTPSLQFSKSPSPSDFPL